MSSSACPICGRDPSPARATPRVAPLAGVTPPRTKPASLNSSAASPAGAARAESNPHHPFCSARCRWIDLGNWFAGTYAIERDLAPDELPPDAARPPGDHRE